MRKFLVCGFRGLRVCGFRGLRVCGFAAVFLLLISLAQAQANNLAVSSVSIASASQSEGTANVQFNLSWDNSWRSDINYDAVWVFVKYSTNAGITWQHATLKSSGTNPAGFSQGTGTTDLDILVPADDKKGAFLQRSANGSGNVSRSAIQLVWDYSGDGVLDSATVRVKVFGIEMVYIPTGAFYVGDGTTTSVTGQFCIGTTVTSPFQITQALQLSGLTLGGGGSNLGNNNASGMYTGYADDFNDITTKTLPSTFPMGYNAFYMMKYEISQGQWVDFFNTLTS